jgi:hypothetical protein
MSVQSQSLGVSRISPGATLLDAGAGGVQKVCSGSWACRISTGTVDISASRVDRLDAAVFSSYLFKTVASGEIGF